MSPRIWLIAGPTASGKSALAVRLAQALQAGTQGAEIVNADSMQLYADIPILSAAPSPAERAVAPHHLFGVADAGDGWSTGRWLRAATQALAQIAARGNAAIVVGGTGLYFSALTQGLSDIPEIDAAIRSQAGAEFEAMGEGPFRDRLHAADPAAADRIAPGDRQRLVRAWEVFAATGKALSDWQGAGAPTINDYTAIALEPPRARIYDRCDARLAAMVNGGALEEVAALTARGLPPTLPAMKAVGVRELSAHLRGEISLPTALTAAKQETRRYAKRQLTWMRGRMAAWPRVTATDAEEQWAEVKRIGLG